jgi:catechol 2,3-dioxygenase-like lactoylglutathione lyase family enzyme
MNHPIDHLVLCVRDLERVRAFYARLGFTLTPRAQHPFGTANHLAQFQGNFLEVLAVADPARIPPPAPGQFSFGAFNAAFLERFEGMSMLVFASDDARRDQVAFAARGLDTYAPFDFQRLAKLPDGSEVTVGFSLAFATHAAMPNAAFFTCQQHAPQYFWKPEYQRHPNGARAVTEVVMVADAPARFRDFFARLLEPGAVTEADGGLRLATPEGAISILTPARFAERYPDSMLQAVPTGPHFAAYRVAVANLESAEAILRKNDVPHRRTDARLLIAPHDAFGVAIDLHAD